MHTGRLHPALTEGALPAICKRLYINKNIYLYTCIYSLKSNLKMLLKERTFSRVPRRACKTQIPKLETFRADLLAVQS